MVDQDAKDALSFLGGHSVGVYACLRCNCWGNKTKTHADLHQSSLRVDRRQLREGGCYK